MFFDHLDRDTWRNGGFFTLVRGDRLGGSPVGALSRSGQTRGTDVYSVSSQPPPSFLLRRCGHINCHWNCRMHGSAAQVMIAVEGDLLRLALAEMVRGMPEFSLRGVAADATTAIMAMRSHKLDVLFLDVVLAEKVKAAIGGHETHLRVLLFSPRRHIGLDAACATDCACGFLRERAPLKHTQVVTRIVASCDVAAAGKSTRCRTCLLRPTLEPAALPLSPREQDVFARIGAGEGNQAIAEALGLSVKTVECHRENCKRKLGLISATQLIAAAVAWRAGDYVPDRDSVLLRR